MKFKKKAKDPVCGMEIKINGSTLTKEYQAKTFYFCSDDCLKKFENEPEKYITLF